jgi:hypothetical protein
MIRALMKVIRENHNMRCYNPPPLIKSHPKIYERRESARNDEGCIDRGGMKISRPLEAGKLLNLPCSFSFLVPQSTL